MSHLSSKNNMAREGIRLSRLPSNHDSCSVDVAFVEISELVGFLQAHEGHILALVSYDSRHDSVIATGCPWVNVDLQQLSEPHLVEVWTSALPVSHCLGSEIACSSNDEIVWGSLRLYESNTSSIDILTCSAYQRILDHVAAMGYPHLLRMWNYLPAINAEDDGLERYKRFCVGRYQAFSERQAEFRRALPSATAIGTRSGPLQVHFLASRHPGVHIENPRQINAYEYPPIYGPRAPAFARGTVNMTERGQQVFIAGTSSIVGHASRHLGDPRKQTIETLKNIKSLIMQVNSDNQFIDLAFLKVYIRHPRHREVIQKTIGESIGMNVPIIYLQGDICRSEMLLEIEGQLMKSNY